LPDEYYEPDSGIEVNGGGGGVFIDFVLKEIFLTFLLFFCRVARQILRTGL
jgi:hypothetical protein